MEQPCSSSRRNRRGLRHGTEHTERHTGQYDSRRTDSDLQHNTDIRHMYRRSLYSDRDGESECNDHRTEHDQLYDDTIQLYANRHDTSRHDIRMEQPYRLEHQWRGLRHRPERSKRHTDEHDSECSDSSIQRNTDLGQLYRSNVHSKRCDQPSSDDRLTGDDELQHGSIQLYTDRHDTGRHDIRMEHTGNRCRHQWRGIRHRQHIDRHTDQQLSECRDSDLQCDTDIGQLHNRDRIYGNSDR